MKPAAKSRTPKSARRQPTVGAVAVKGHAPAFRKIIGLIQSARQRAFQAECVSTQRAMSQSRSARRLR